MTSMDSGLPNQLRREPVTGRVFGPVQWAPVVAGAIAAAALAFVLHSVAIGMGLSAGSAAPSWRDASFALVLLSALYLVLAAIASYGFGGYVSGLLREPMTAPADEVEFKDGIHGLLVWGLATLLTAAFALATAQSLTRLAAPASGSAGPATSVGGENIIAFDLDRLLRSERAVEGNINYDRAQAARILLTTSSHRGMLPEDRTFLVRLVAARTGLAQPEAERRVDDVAARAKENIARARRAGVIMAFAAGAAALLGAAAAWFAACAGGQVRDGAISPSGIWDWRHHGRRT
jgi:hypothetical protein